MAKLREYQVYGLYCACGCDPSEPIRYVGQASMGARDRFSKHKYSARNDEPWPVCRWMRKHGIENIRYRVLESFETGEEMDAAEAVWIERLSTLTGKSGYNIRSGGNGSRGYSHSPWAKSRLTHEISPETRRKISETLKGRYTGEESRNTKISQLQAEEVIRRYWEGETIDQIHQALELPFSTVSGITCGQSWQYLPRPDRPRVVKSSGKFEPGTKPQNTKLTEDKVRDIRKRFEQGEHPRTLGAEYGVTPENVHMIVRYKTWKHVT